MLNPSDHELDHLLLEYRDACADPEPSGDFMPGLWRRIESRQVFSRGLRRVAQGWVTVAAMVCLLMAGVVFTQATFNNDPRTYVEALDEDPNDDFSEVAVIPASYEGKR